MMVVGKREGVGRIICVISRTCIWILIQSTRTGQFVAREKYNFLQFIIFFFFPRSFFRLPLSFLSAPRQLLPSNAAASIFFIRGGGGAGLFRRESYK